VTPSNYRPIGRLDTVQFPYRVDGRLDGVRLGDRGGLPPKSPSPPVTVTARALNGSKGDSAHTPDASPLPYRNLPVEHS